MLLDILVGKNVGQSVKMHSKQAALSSLGCARRRYPSVYNLNTSNTNINCHSYCKKRVCKKYVIKESMATIIPLMM